MKNQITQTNIHRFICMTEAVNFLTAHFNLNRQQATHFVWDNEFTIGTDRAIWIDVKSLIAA